MREWQKVGLLVVALFALMGGLFVVVGVFRVHSTHVSCLRLHEQTGLETRVARSGFDAECFIRMTNGQWVPEDRYRAVDGD